MDLVMAGKDDRTNVKLFLYIIDRKGREIYETQQFDKAPPDQMLFDVIAAFAEHCNSRKNETVKRYKFFTRIQEPAETLDKFITDLKLHVLATTCNFGTLSDSLICDQIVCGMRDSKLRERNC